MLTLITFPAGSDEPSHSPFCVKAMILLQMSGQNWQREDISRPGKMPYGQLPVLQVENKSVPDSEFIQDWLTEQGVDFYPNCTDDQIAFGRACIRMVEEGLRNMLVYDRWMNDTCWPHVWPVLFADAPAILRKFIAGKVRKTVTSGLVSQGTGRLSLNDRLRKADADLNVLGHCIGGNKFMLGNTPTAVDAAILPVLSMIDRLPVATELTQLLRSKTWAKDYLQHGRSTLYNGLIK